MAAVEYPAKSKNICPENASVPDQASQKFKTFPDPNTLSATPESNVSAKTTI